MSLTFDEFRKMCKDHGLYPTTINEKFWGLDFGIPFSFVRWSNNIIIIPEGTFDYLKLVNGELKYVGVFSFVPKKIKKDKDEFEKYLKNVEVFHKHLRIEEKLNALEKDFND